MYFIDTFDIKPFYINIWLNFLWDSCGTYVGLIYIHIMKPTDILNAMRLRITYQMACYNQNYIIWQWFNFDCDTTIDWLKSYVIFRLGFVHPTFRLRGERSNPLRHRCGLQYLVFYAHVPYALHAKLWQCQISKLSFHFIFVK